MRLNDAQDLINFTNAVCCVGDVTMRCERVPFNIKTAPTST